MRKKSQILLVIVIFQIFVVFVPTPVKAIQFTANNYWYFVDEPTTIDFPDMKFTVINDLDVDVQVNVSFMTVEGVDLEVFFEWDSVILGVEESKTNHYAIKINSSLAVTVNVQMLIKQKPLISGEQIVSTGGIVVNRVTFYTQEEGALLDLHIVDQSGWPRNATIDIQYRMNQSLSWSPIKNMVGLGYTGYLPKGFYFIRARDFENPNIYAEKTFEMTNDTTVSLALQLVGFKIFQVLFTKVQFEDQNITICGLNVTINNHVGTLEEVKIYAEMYENKTLIQSTLPSEYSEFPKTENFQVSLWFAPINWQNATNYVVRGIIQSRDLIIATKEKDFWYYKDEVPTSEQQFPLIELLGTLGLFGVAVLIWKYKTNLKGKEIEKLVERHAK